MRSICAILNTLMEAPIPGSQLRSAEEVLFDALRRREPIVLVLGQDAWADSNETDPVLTVALQRLGRSNEGAKGWPSLIGPEALADNFYEWLAERFNRRPRPNWLGSIARLPWTAVFTSSLDPSLVEAFASQRRSPQPILTSTEVPTAGRSTTRTPIYYLFGRAGIADPRAMAPRTRTELRARLTLQAIPMLNRLPDTATSVGLVVIDGFNRARDWMPSDSLLAVIDQMPAGRVLWCGWKDEFKVHEELCDVIQAGKILTSPLRIGSLVAELGSNGKLNDVTLQTVSQSGGISFQKGELFVPSGELRIRVEAVASIIDDSWLTLAPTRGLESEYADFRQFHGDSGGIRNLVQGVLRGYAIIRDFENNLWQVVKTAVEEHARFDPLIVHGQSGTGKTIALGRLITRIREDRRGAVLCSIGRIPQPADIAVFCELAEQHGATATVVICDCNLPINRYRDLLIGLRSRGRKVVVIGSSYRQTAKSLPPIFIEAPEALSESEREQLANLVARFGDGNLPHRIGHDKNVLATLYRALPASRYRLSAGLGGEARAAEATLRERGARHRPVERKSVLAEKLVAAGLATETEAVLAETLDDVLRSADDSAGRVIDLVMAAGRINCPVPVNLLMRAVTAGRPTDLSLIAQMFQGLDLFRWRRAEDNSEELLVSPRLTLEADLICRRRLMDATAEGAQLVALVRAARLSWDAVGSERRFVLDLVQNMGPDGPLRSRYRQSYLDAARSLTELRQVFGIEDPSLMLQEAVLRRSAIREGVVDGADTLNVLEDARQAVQAGIDHLAGRTGRGARRMIANLSVERAAIYGFLATYRMRQSASAQEVWSAYQAARAAARSATAISDTYFPFDVSLWIPADLLDFTDLTPQQYSELVADIYSVLDRIEPASLPPEQRERFHERLYKLGERLRSHELSDQALAGLEREGSTSGYYLKARSLGPQIFGDEPDDLSTEDRRRAREASAYLRSKWSSVASDERCLRYLLQCDWIVAVGRRLLRGERSPLPAEERDRRELLRLVRDLIALDQAAVDNSLRYLDAVLSWINNEEHQAQRIWRELARDTDFVDARRVIRRHIVTDQTGAPVLYSGRIEDEAEPGRFTVRVHDLNRRVQLLGRDFRDLELAYGRTVPSFCIAFNYIGPIADPPPKGSGR